MLGVVLGVLGLRKGGGLGVASQRASNVHHRGGASKSTRTFGARGLDRARGSQGANLPMVGARGTWGGLDALCLGANPLGESGGSHGALLLRASCALACTALPCTALRAMLLP